MPKGVYKRKPMSDECKRNLSEKLKGHPVSPETREKIRQANIGKKHTIKSRLKISEGLKGEKSYRWKGGVTPERRRLRDGVEMRLWRESVFTRDNWTCQMCLKRGGDLHAHHIKPFYKYRDLMFDSDNGQTLCVKCHRKVHSNGQKD